MNVRVVTSESVTSTAPPGVAGASVAGTTGGSDSAFIPWAWAANGCASVIGSVCAVLGAMAWNFSTMLIAAGVVYVITLVTLSRTKAQLA